MTDNNASNIYPSFSAHLDGISDLSSSLVGPSPLFQSQFTQPWQGEVTPFTDGRGDNRYYDTSQIHSFVSYDGQQDASVYNQSQGTLGNPQRRTTSGSGDRASELSSEELLQEKRAKAMASLSQRRTASRGADPNGSDKAYGGSGAQSSSTAQGINSTIDQVKPTNGSAAGGSAANSNEDSSASAAQGKHHTSTHQVASAEDIDGLLAEGRVSATANALKASKKDQNSGDSVDTQRTSVSQNGNGPSTINKSTIIKHQPTNGNGVKLESDGLKAKHSLVTDEASKSNMAGNGDITSHRDLKRTLSGQDSRADLKSYPERRIYEPPRRAFTDSSAYRPVTKGEGPQSGNHSGKQSSPLTANNHEIDNEFAKLQPSEVEELREWLMHTGFWDEAYRRRTLDRNKRLAALEREKENIMREELQEREAMAKNSDWAPFLPPRSQSFDNHGHESRASPSMPPPSHITKVNTTSSTKLGDAKKDSNTRLSDESPSSHVSPSSVIKRQYSDLDHDPHHERAGKLLRADVNGNSRNGTHNTEATDFMNKDRKNFIKERKPSDGDDSLLEEGETKSSHRESSGGWGKPYDPFVYGSRHHGDEDDMDSYEIRGGSWRGRGRGRGRGTIRGRGRGRGGFSGTFDRELTRTSSHSEYAGSDKLNLGGKGVTYFLIKCPEFAMVEAALKERTWSTQPKNIVKFAEAFDTSRHVILFFSVNQSGAYQGYARMESRPGAPGVTPPSWATDVDKALSPPFKISWINTKETPFRFVGHLENPFNDNHVVTYARDGQELEPECGRILCEILDEKRESY
ncbi:hypothetical protein AJ79_05983 [Helicocarpus griseus UAMH5409]|uniref:YTH domain-containing protein n=1 Tax=Helicocarpus griseus UAMH5409 TaxID=1447875 RepID=A0A2B7XA21_9EURO|nr:hypothetical protein AJ79_05983 [Helicocarpus griseus UAMH5409]